MADRRRGKLGPAILRELTRLEEAGVPPAPRIRDFFRDLRNPPKPYSEEEYPDPLDEPPAPDVDDTPPRTYPEPIPGDTYDPGPNPGPMLPGDDVFPDPVDPALPIPAPWPGGTTAFLPRESQTPRALRGGLPPALAALHSLLRIPGPRSRKKRRGSSAASTARPRTARARTHLPGLPGTSGIFGSALSFRGPPVRSPGLPSEPYPIVTDPRGPVLWPSTRKQREGSPRTLEEALEQLHRTNPFDINPLPELKPPRRVIRPRTPAPETAPDPLPMPPDPLPMPQPTIPAPSPRYPPQTWPAVPGSVPPQLPPRPPPATQPRPFKTAPIRIKSPAIGVATVGLSAILRRQTQAATALVRQFVAPFDPITNTPIGDVAPPRIADPLPQPLPPTVGPLPPQLAPPLTSLNDQALGLRPRDRRKEDECKCEEEAEEKKTPRPSRIVATVKSFARRMSQNSLDNLR